MAIPRSGAPAIPIDVLRQGLANNCLSERNIRSLLQDPVFVSLEYRSHQILHVYDWGRSHLQTEIAIDSLERAFNCSRSTVRAVLVNRYDPPKQRGRHPGAAPHSQAEILAWIKRNAEKSTPVTRTELRHYCTAKFDILVTRGWVDSVILRHESELVETKSTRSEELRLQISRILRHETICCM
jgi:transposase